VKTVLGQKGARRIRLVKYDGGFPEIVLWVEPEKP
jgi:hypothetical protein